MSLVIIRLRRVMNRVVHIQDQAQDRTTVVAAHTHAVAVVDPHRTAVVDRHPMAAEARRHTVAEAGIAIRNRLPATANVRLTLLQTFSRRTKNERRTTNRRSFCF